MKAILLTATFATLAIAGYEEPQFNQEETFVALFCEEEAVFAALNDETEETFNEETLIANEEETFNDAESFNEEETLLANEEELCGETEETLLANEEETLSEEEETLLANEEELCEETEETLLANEEELCNDEEGLLAVTATYPDQRELNNTEEEVLV